MKVVIASGVRGKSARSNSQSGEYSGNACVALTATGRSSPLVMHRQRRPSLLAIGDSQNGLLLRDSSGPTYASLNLLQIGVE